MKLKPDEIITIAGQRGTGKTTLAVYLAQKFINSGYKVVFIDPHQELRIRGAMMFYDPNVEKQESLLRRVWETGNTVLFVDEAQNLFRASPHPLKDVKAYIVNQGRHKGIGLVAISPRVQQLHNDILAQSSIYFLFRMQLPRDIEVLEEFIGPVAYKLRYLPNYYFIMHGKGKTVIHKPVPSLRSIRKKFKRKKRK